MMNCKCSPQTMRNVGLLALRLVVGIIFIYSGWMKLSNMTMTVGSFGALGIPAFLAYVVAIVEFVGGIAVLLGLFIRDAAILLAIIMVVAILTVHLKQPFMQWFLPLSLLGSTLALAGVGGGRWQVLCKKESIWHGCVNGGSCGDGKGCGSHKDEGECCGQGGCGSCETKHES